MFSGIEHVGVLAENPEKLAQWYERVLNFQVIYTSNDSRPTIFLAGDNGQLLELIPDQSENQVPNKDKRFHLAIKVNDFNEALAKLRAEKVETETSFDIFRGGKVVFFQDPEGNWLHLIFRPENPWKNWKNC